MSDFDISVCLLLRGEDPHVTVRREIPRDVWAYDRRPTHGRLRRAHLTAAMYRGEGQERFLTTQCGVSLWDDFDPVGVEDATDFCDACLMSGHIVYTFRAADGAPLYVGQTSRPVARLTQHRYNSPWWFWAASVEAVVVTPDDALRIERETILRLNPPYNRYPRRRAVQVVA